MIPEARQDWERGHLWGRGGELQDFLICRKRQMVPSRAELDEGALSHRPTAPRRFKPATDFNQGSTG